MWHVKVLESASHVNYDMHECLLSHVMSLMCMSCHYKINGLCVCVWCTCDFSCIWLAVIAYLNGLYKDILIWMSCDACVMTVSSDMLAHEILVVLEKYL